MTRASLVATATALLLGLTALPAAARPLASPAARKSRCHASDVHVTVRGKKVCLAVHISPAADQLRASVLADRRLGRSVRLKPRRHHRGAPRRAPAWTRSKGLARAIDRGLKIAAGMPSGAPVVAAARVATASADEPQPIHEVKPFERNGWKGEVEHDLDPMNGSPTSQADFGYDETRTIRAHKDGKSEVLVEEERIAAAQCPEVSGRVAGTHTWTYTDRITGPDGDGTFSALVALSAKTKITGHTTDDGHLRDYDLDMHYVSNRQTAIRDAQGNVISAAPPEVYALDFSKHGLHLLSYEDFSKGRADPATHEILSHGFDVGMANGPDGSYLSGVRSNSMSHGEMAEFETATGRLAIAEMRASNLLKTLESAWLNGYCLQIDLSSSDVALPHEKDLTGHDQPDGYSAVLRAGQKAHFTAVVKSPQGGALAAGTYALTARRDAADAGSVSPTGGSFAGAPLPFVYTAPTHEWTPPQPDTVSLSVQAHSHQGQKRAVITISPAPTGYRLLYTHTSTAGYSYPYGPEGTFEDHGTYSEQRDIALSASVPLTLDATQTTGTGSGTLGWQRSSWTTDDDDTARSGQSFSTWCEIEYHDQVTGTTPGTLQVKALKLGPPGADGRPTVAGMDVVLANAGESWHLTETQKSGPCPGFDSDSHEEHFLNDFVGFHTQQGDDVTTVSDPSDPESPDDELKADSGWVAGSGDVIAQRTFTGTYADGAHSGAPAGAVVHWTDTFQLVPASG